MLPQTDAPTGANAARWRRYLESLNDSKFVLCPRGFGTSLWILFEVMKAGRAPVVLSDRWTRPKGPDWDAFSITIKTHPTSPASLTVSQAEKQMPHRIVESCLAIRDARVVPERIVRISAYGELLRPRNVRRYLLSPLKQRFLTRVR